MPCGERGRESKFDYRIALEIMKDHIVHCHFKDGVPGGDGYPAGDGYGLTLMGEGEINFPWIVEQLGAVRYDGDFALEYEIHREPEVGLKQFYDAFAAMR